MLPTLRKFGNLIKLGPCGVGVETGVPEPVGVGVPLPVGVGVGTGVIVGVGVAPLHSNLPGMRDCVQLFDAHY